MPRDDTAIIRPKAGISSKLAFVDCLRGYAVLLVIATHVRTLYPELPYPLAAWAQLGWSGVQLFFMMSCFTLLNSWHNESAHGRPSARAFFVRRLFRIAPMYYCAAILYFLVSPPSKIDLSHAAAWLSFVNGWTPHGLAADGGWAVVPGGWSITVECEFYVLCPLIFMVVTNLRRAVAFLLITLMFGAAVNHWALDYFAPTDGQAAASNFTFSWLPSQMPIFALGAVLYFLWREGAFRQPLVRLGNVLPVLGLIGYAGFVYLPITRVLDLQAKLPAAFGISLVFLIFCLALSQAQPGLFVNRAMAAMGKVSFSAYLLHFALLEIAKAYPEVFGLQTTRWAAAGYFSVTWLTVVIATYGISSLTYRFIEQPMMRLGKSVSRRARWRKAHQAAYADTN